jgi:hypothetical protein
VLDKRSAPVLDKRAAQVSDKRAALPPDGQEHPVVMTVRKLVALLGRRPACAVHDLRLVRDNRGRKVAAALCRSPLPGGSCRQAARGPY